MQNKILLIGKIYTANSSNDFAEAVLISGNKIEAVGEAEHLRRMKDNNTELIEIKKGIVVPGFIDSHAHFLLGGGSLNSVDFANAFCREDFRNTLKKFVKVSSTEWILGGNWNHQQFTSVELPHKNWVDDITFEAPLFVTKNDIHMGLANSIALKLAGINKDTPNPAGGVIMKDYSTGEPTGILIDSAMKLVTNIIPEKTIYEKTLDIIAAFHEAKINGLTSIHDITTCDSIDIYSDLLKQNKITCRIYGIYPIDDIEYFISKRLHEKFNSAMLKVKGIKAFADGSLGSNTAWFFEPYEDDKSSCGLPMELITNGKLKRIAEYADAAGLQMVVHAIGDRAIAETIDIFEDISLRRDITGNRHRIEHVQHVRSKDIERMKKLGLIASFQPYQIFDDGVWCETKIGKDRLKGTHAYKTFLSKGVKVCFGSDWTVTPLNPLLGIWSAVTRKTKSNLSQTGWLPLERISVQDAVRAYTIDAAFASFDESVKGSIEKGKLADIAILDKDIFIADPDEIKTTSVAMTIFDGKVIYRKEEKNN